MKIKGLDELNEILMANAEIDTRSALRRGAEALASHMREQTDLAYVKGYSTGELKRGIRAEGSTITVDAPYFDYVEYGTRHMAAEPIIEPSIHKAENKILRLLEDEIEC